MVVMGEVVPLVVGVHVAAGHFVENAGGAMVVVTFADVVETEAVRANRVDRPTLV